MGKIYFGNDYTIQINIPDHVSISLKIPFLPTHDSCWDLSDHMFKYHRKRLVSFQNLENQYGQKSTFLTFWQTHLSNLEVIQSEDVTISINDDDSSESKQI